MARLDEAVAGFLARRDLRPRSITVYRQTLTRLCAHTGPGTGVDRIGPADLQSFLDAYYADAAPATWNLNLAALRSFYAYARRQHLIAGDPTRGDRAPPAAPRPRPAGHPHPSTRRPVAAHRPTPARQDTVAAAV